MTIPFLNIRNYVLAITIVVALGGLVISKAWIQDHITGFALALILGGIPHGASDYLIFNQLFRKGEAVGHKLKFLVYYVSAMAAYGLLWWTSPLMAFSLFILVSIYHFGQSNWQYVEFKDKLQETVSYMLWGLLVVGFPVLLYHEQSSLIILEITGYSLNLGPVRLPAIFLIVLTNLVQITNLSEANLITGDAMKRELFQILVLVLLFASTPLLIGFGIYFVLWHSLSSTLDQITIFQSFNKRYNLKRYFLDMAPFTLLALLGLGFLYLWLGESMDHGLNLGVLFLFISIITVPHSILMDRFYLAQTTKNKE